MGTLSILDKEQGDQTIGWDKNNPAEIEESEATFDRLRALGYLAYKVDKKGGRGEQIFKFDPNAESIILSPALKGG